MPYYYDLADEDDGNIFHTVIKDQAMPLNVGDKINPPVETVPAMSRGRLLTVVEIIQDLDEARASDRHRVKVLLRAKK